MICKIPPDPSLPKRGKEKSKITHSITRRTNLKNGEATGFDRVPLKMISKLLCRTPFHEGIGAVVMDRFEVFRFHRKPDDVLILL